MTRLAGNHPSFRARMRRMCRHRMVLVATGQCLACGSQRQPPRTPRVRVDPWWDKDEEKDPRDWDKIDPSNPLRSG